MEVFCFADSVDGCSPEEEEERKYGEVRGGCLKAWRMKVIIHNRSEFIWSVIEQTVESRAE